MMEIYKDFVFEAAHRLPNLPADHKCGRLHGHSFHVRVFVSGPINETTGWVLDFADLKRSVQPHIDLLDHTYLNEIAGLENPTSENIAVWLGARLIKTLPQLTKVEVKETCTSGVIYNVDKSR